VYALPFEDYQMSRLRHGLVGGLLFPAPKPSYTIDSFPSELIWVPKGPVDDIQSGTGLGGKSSDSCPCLLLTYESARFIIIFFHSNAEDLGLCRWFCLFLRDQFQVHVLAVEYPGYGVCPGPTSCEAIMDNAHAALQFVTQGLQLPLDRIKLFGRSIGTGPTLALAAKFKVAGVILVTPFLSIRAIFRERIGVLAFMIEEWFANDENVKKIKSPTMIVHGRKDRLIPWSHGEALYKDCQSRKLFINPQNMEHNTNLSTDISLLVVPMFRFFSLPDYSFQELKIPAWAHDKRRSPLYVRPDVQVCSHAAQVSLSGAEGVAGTMFLPAGDDEEEEVDHTQELPQPEMPGQTPSSCGDIPPTDYDKIAVLTHPTVLHSYSATKQRYNFHDRSSVDTSSLQIPLETQRPTDSHDSATKPPSPVHGQGGG